MQANKKRAEARFTLSLAIGGTGTPTRVSSPASGPLFLRSLGFLLAGKNDDEHADDNDEESDEDNPHGNPLVMDDESLKQAIETGQRKSGPKPAFPQHWQ